jgi:diguanylate cyclase (GGDEF)-like protein
LQSTIEPMTDPAAACRHPSRLVAWLCATAIALLPRIGDAAPPVVALDSQTQALDLTPHVEFLEDPQHALTIEAVAADRGNLAFQPAPPGVRLAGLSKSAFWLRFRLASGPAVRGPLVLEVDYPLLDRVELFEEQRGGGFTRRESGDALPFARRELAHASPAFLIEPPGEVPKSYYLRVESTGGIQVPLTLMRYDTFAAHLETGQLVLGLFHGMLLILTATGLLLYGLMRDRIFLLFAGFIGGYTLLQAALSGLAFQLFWPEATWWASRAAPVLVVLTGLFAAAFIRDFLESRARLPTLDRFLVGLNAVGGAVAVATLVDVRWGIRLSALYATVLIGASVGGALLLSARGFRPARYFAAAMSAFLIGMLVASLTYVGLLPYSNLTPHAMQIGTLLLAVMIAIAITTRIRDLQVARARAAESAQKYLTALNQELERLVRDRTKALERKNEELKELAARDSLTGLLNHRAVIEQFHHALNSAYRYREPLAVIMVDIDHFKAVNDRFGHQAGDTVLMTLARLLLQNVRAADVCGRYGGEEFLLLLPKAVPGTAYELAERLRRQIHGLEMAELQGTRVTASFGFAELDLEGPPVSGDDLIRRADEALYQAKRLGRNRVCCAADGAVATGSG